MFLDEATHIHHVGVALAAVVAAEVVGSIDGPGDGSIVKPLLQIGVEVFGIGIKGSAEGGNGAEVNDGHGGTVAVVIFHGGLIKAVADGTAERGPVGIGVSGKILADARIVPAGAGDDLFRGYKIAGKGGEDSSGFNRAHQAGVKADHFKAVRNQ